MKTTTTTNVKFFQPFSIRCSSCSLIHSLFSCGWTSRKHLFCIFICSSFSGFLYINKEMKEQERKNFSSFTGLVNSMYLSIFNSLLFFPILLFVHWFAHSPLYMYVCKHAHTQLRCTLFLLN